MVFRKTPCFIGINFVNCKTTFQYLQMKNKTIASLLAFFLGGFGVHRFYLGQLRKGLMYLFFCWTLIPFFIALIDVFGFIIMSKEQFNMKYNSHFWV